MSWDCAYCNSGLAHYCPKCEPQAGFGKRIAKLEAENAELKKQNQKLKRDLSMAAKAASLAR